MDSWIFFFQGDTLRIEIVGEQEILFCSRDGYFALTMDVRRWFGDKIRDLGLPAVAV